MASTAAGGGEARGAGGFNPPRLNPHLILIPNPSGDGGPGNGIRSPPGKGSKPAALADITNFGKPNAARSVTVPDLLKENAKLMNLLNEKARMVELSRIEICKLRVALQASKQQNVQLVQNNSQMLAEINTGKDRIKLLQHELSCTNLVLKVKRSELDEKKNTANVKRKGVKSQVQKGTATVVEAHHFPDSVTIGVEHHLVESQSALSSNTVCQELPQDGKKKRMPQRRSSRLNQGFCEISGVSQDILHDDTVEPLPTSTLGVQKRCGRNTRQHMKSLQNECGATVNGVVMASEFEETEIHEQPEKTDLKEIPEAASREAEVQSHTIGGTAFNSRQRHLTESQSYLSLNIADHPKPPEDNGIKRCSKKRSATEDANAGVDTTTSKPLRHKETRKAQRRSARLNLIYSVDTNVAVDTADKDGIASLADSISNVSMEQKTNQKQNGDCFSRKSNVEKRSVRRAAEKVVSYKEPPLNVKMRRP